MKCVGGEAASERLPTVQHYLMFESGDFWWCFHGSLKADSDYELGCRMEYNSQPLMIMNCGHYQEVKPGAIETRRNAHIAHAFE